MKTSIRLLAAAAALAAAGACTLQSQDAPSPTGPSEFALSLAITATPDVIFQDGGSQSLITIVARDHNAQPIAGLGLLVQTLVGSTIVDYGQLSARTLVTDAQGRATVVYTAPAAPAPPALAADSIVRILVTPVGSNYDNSFVRDVSIRLTPPGVILPPNGTPTADFSFSPSSPDAGDVILFDASASDDTDGSIVSYQWNWGDGEVDTTTSPLEQHDYIASGSYVVTLTVVDDDDASASSSQQVVVGTAPRPTAVFTFSPQQPAPGTNVNFNASESTAPEGRTLVEYRWNFGDGTTATTSGPTTSHVFAAEGDYVVTLTVVDSEGQTHTVSQTVGVET